MLSNKSLLKNFYKYRRKSCEIALSAIQKLLQCRRLTQSAGIQKPKVLFFGTDHFSLPSLQALHKNNASSSLGVVTSFKSPANCVRTYAEHEQLPLHRWPVSADVCCKYDVGVVVSFGQLIPERIIKSFPFGMINVHASLLPRWRGAAPIIYAIMSGDVITGVSIMKIEPKHFDIGDVLAQRKVSIKENILMPTLHAELASIGANLLVEVINGFPASFENATKQNSEAATFAPKVSSAIIEASWSELSAEQLYRRFRALFGYKHLNTRFKGKVMQLLDVKLPTTVLDAGAKLEKHGAFIYLRDRRCLLVRCADDSLLEVHQLRIEGKKAMSASDFNNGFLKKLKSDELLFTIDKDGVC